jgi:hypothetical protein
VGRFFTAAVAVGAAACAAACVPATTYGLRTDGLPPGPGGVEASAFGGSGTTLERFSPFPAGGLAAAIGVTDDVSAASSVGLADGVFVANAEVRWRGRHTEQDTTHLAVLAGAGLVVDRTSWWGPHVGSLLAQEVAPDIRLFTGVTFNPVFGTDSDDVAFFFAQSAGVSWRPALGGRGSALVSCESFWMVPFQPRYYTPPGIGLILMVGARWGGR